MTRRRSEKPLGNKEFNLHIRLDKYHADLMHAACAHRAMSVSTYIRWLIATGSKQLLEGPSKADDLKEFEKNYHALHVRPKGPIPQVKTLKPGEVRPPEPVIEPAPMYWDGPKQPARPPEPPKQAVPAQPPTPPLSAPPAPAKPATGGIPFKEIFGFDPSETDGPRAAELPDDMDDWT